MQLLMVLRHRALQDPVGGETVLIQHIYVLPRQKRLVSPTPSLLVRDSHVAPLNSRGSSGIVRAYSQVVESQRYDVRNMSDCICVVSTLYQMDRSTLCCGQNHRVFSELKEGVVK